MHFDIYGSVRSNSCKDMVNKKKTFGSALCSIPPCLNLPGPESEHVTKHWFYCYFLKGQGCHKEVQKRNRQVVVTVLWVVLPVVVVESSEEEGGGRGEGGEGRQGQEDRQ